MPDSNASSGNIDALLFKALLEKAADTIYFKDKDGRLLRVSNRMVGSLNMDHPSQVEGKLYTDFVTPEQAADTLKSEQEVLRTGMPVINVEEKEVWPDDSVTWAACSKFPLYDDDGNLIGLFGIHRDITEQKEAQEKLAQTQRELIEQEKKAAVSEFAGMIVANMGSSVVEMTAAADRATGLIQSAKADPAALSKAQEELREVRHMAKRLMDLMKIQGV